MTLLPLSFIFSRRNRGTFVLAKNSPQNAFSHSQQPWVVVLAATLATGTIHISLHFPSRRAGMETNRGENCSWDYLQNSYITHIFQRRCLWVHFLRAGWEISYITETQGAGKAQSINKAHWSSLELRWWVCTASWQSDSLAMSKVFVSPDSRDSKGYVLPLWSSIWCDWWTFG